MTQPASRDPAISRPRVREQLAQRLRTIEELDAFCLDYFPVVKARFAGGMDRLARENLLLEMQDPAEVQAALQRYSGQRLYARRKLASWGLVALVPLGAALMWQFAGPLLNVRSGGPVSTISRVIPVASDVNLTGVRFEEPMEFAGRAQRLQKSVRMEAKVRNLFPSRTMLVQLQQHGPPA
jgi:hypothetical protein